jgi:hypothetical protein
LMISLIHGRHQTLHGLISWVLEDKVVVTVVIHLSA